MELWLSENASRRVTWNGLNAKIPEGGHTLKPSEGPNANVAVGMGSIPATPDRVELDGGRLSRVEKYKILVRRQAVNTEEEKYYFTEERSIKTVNKRL